MLPWQPAAAAAGPSRRKEQQRLLQQKQQRRQRQEGRQWGAAVARTTTRAPPLFPPTTPPPHGDEEEAEDESESEGESEGGEDEGEREGGSDRRARRRRRRVIQVVGVVSAIVAVGVLVMAGVITAEDRTTDFMETTRKVEFETMVDGDQIMVKGLFFSRQERHMRLALQGGASRCNFQGTDVAALIDVHGKLVRSNMAHLGSPAAPCVLDLKFMFRRFRRMIVSHKSVVFVNHGLDEDGDDGSLACLRTPDSGRSLCELEEAGVRVHFFSSQANYYENVDHFALTTGDGDSVVDLFPSPASSVRTSQPIIDVVVAWVMAAYDIHYDIILHRIAFRPRRPSRAIKQVVAILGALVSIFFVVRLMKEDTYRVRVYHWTSLSIALVTVAVSLASGSGALGSVWFVWTTAAAAAVHLAVEIYRFHVHTTRTADGGGKAVRVMQSIDIKPDMGILLIAMIVSMYTIASHSLVVLATFVVIFFSIKTVSETVNARWVTGMRAAVIYAVCVTVDIAYALVLWHFVVWEFMSQTLVAKWYVQEILLIVVTLAAGVFVAHVRFRSRIMPALRAR